MDAASSLRFWSSETHQVSIIAVGFFMPGVTA